MLMGDSIPLLHLPKLSKISRKTDSTALPLSALLSQQISVGSKVLIKNNTDNAVFAAGAAERIR